MSAATTAINTPERAGQFIEGLFVAAEKTVYAGTLGALDADGNVVPASDTAGLIVAGRVEAMPLKDTFKAGESVLLKRGVFVFSNSGTNPLTAEQIGKICVVEDDNTVAATSANKIGAGRFLGFPDGDITQAIVDTIARPATEDALPA